MDPVKELEGFDAGQQLAVIKKLGGKEVKDALLSGDVTVEIKKVHKKLFDKHGRRIPENLKAKVRDAVPGYRQLDQPKLDEGADFAKRILRLHECLGIDTEITAEWLKAETERVLAVIKGNARIANILNGVYLPIVLPKFTTDGFGNELNLYMDGIKNSYIKTFSGRWFGNHRRNSLVNGKIKIVDESRHYQLIGRMKQGPVIGLHFPSSLQGFSIPASREQMSTLPEGFILSGMDTPIAIIMYPDVLVHGNAPGLELAAFMWENHNHYFFNFWAYDNSLEFGGRDIEVHDDDSYSSGLLFLG